MMDHEYIAARNKLIPEAFKIAQERVSGLKHATMSVTGVNGEPYRWHFIDEFFHEEMNRLAVGLQCKK